MAKVIYQGRADAVTVGKTLATRGEPVDVDAELAAELVASGVWSVEPKPTVKSKSTTKPAKGVDAEEATK